MRIRSASFAFVVVGALTASCRPDNPDREASRQATEPIGLVDAGIRIVGFLRGEVPFDSIPLADTVALYLGREEGGTRRDVPRELLRDRRNWTVHSESLRHTYPFAPPPGNASLTTRVGRHVRCVDHPLSATFPELARLPHVGTTLRYGADSCLQTWNLTLVFDARARPWKLVAALYDQFEW